ncbi:MAG: ATP-dependent 6-phosphofructokinase [Actinobacteria bacterium]|nr:MAG: ATP-dependent 6-phosphofructokinase [Actinomycetota bacterium]
MKIALLTGGGDSPATNAAIRAVVRVSYEDGQEVIGVRNGWAGMINNDMAPLGVASVSGILPKGGTILGTSRTNPFKLNAVDAIRSSVADRGIGAIIAIGGDDTLGVAHRLNSLDPPIRAVGIPQTIDNDISLTDYAIGFDTAVAIVTDALDKLHTTAESHHRVMVLEVMGRDAGHVALTAGLAGGADIILVPERPFDLDQICDRIEKRRELGKTFSLVVIAEGAAPKGGKQISKTEKVDQFGHPILGGIGEYVATQIADRCKLETRVTNLGHLQRGGIPSPFDRLLGTRFGAAAVKLVKEERWDMMVALQGMDVKPVSLADALAETKPVDPELLALADIFY